MAINVDQEDYYFGVALLIFLLKIRTQRQP